MRFVSFEDVQGRERAGLWMGERLLDLQASAARLGLSASATMEEALRA